MTLHQNISENHTIRTITHLDVQGYWHIVKNQPEVIPGSLTLAQAAAILSYAGDITGSLPSRQLTAFAEAVSLFQDKLLQLMTESPHTSKLSRALMSGHLSMIAPPAPPAPVDVFDNIPVVDPTEPAPF